MSEENNKIYITISDSILRQDSAINSNLITVILKDTQVKLMEELTEEKDGEKFAKVFLSKNNIYPNDYTGWILHKQIKKYKPSLSLESKNKILSKLNEYLNLKTAY